MLDKRTFFADELLYRFKCSKSLNQINHNSIAINILSEIGRFLSFVKKIRFLLISALYSINFAPLNFIFKPYLESRKIYETLTIQI